MSQKRWYKGPTKWNRKLHHKLHKSGHQPIDCKTVSRAKFRDGFEIITLKTEKFNVEFMRLQHSTGPFYGNMKLSSYDSYGIHQETFSWVNRNPFVPELHTETESNNANTSDSFCNDDIDSDDSFYDSESPNKNKKIKNKNKSPKNKNKPPQKKKTQKTNTRRKTTPFNAFSRSPPNPNYDKNARRNPSSSQSNSIPPHQRFYHFVDKEHELKLYEMIFIANIDKYDECNERLKGIADSRKAKYILKTELKLCTELFEQIVKKGDNKNENNNCERPKKKKRLKSPSPPPPIKQIKEEYGNINFETNINGCCVCNKIVGNAKQHWIKEINMNMDEDHGNCERYKCTFNCKAQITTFANKPLLEKHLLFYHQKEKRRTNNLPMTCPKARCKMFDVHKKHKCTAECEKEICGGAVYAGWKSQNGKYILKCRNKFCKWEKVAATAEHQQMVAGAIKSKKELCEEFPQHKQPSKSMPCPICKVNVETTDLGYHIQKIHQSNS